MTDIDTTKKRKILSKVPGAELFSQTEIEAIAKEAETKVLEDKKKAVRKLILEEKIREEKRKIDPNEEFVDYRVKLPRFATHIMIDGVQFYHEQTYKFTRMQLSSIMPLVQSMWHHQQRISNESSSEYHHKLNDIFRIVQTAA